MIDFYHYIYKYFKTTIFGVLMLCIYIVAYIDAYVVYANDTYISDSYILEQQMRYTNALYGLDTDISEDTILEEKEISIDDVSDIYNTVKHDFTISIEKLGIDEDLFAFPMTYSIEEYEYVNSKKNDPNMIDFELMDSTDINKWFMIGWHSSWYWTDSSVLKKVFNSLDNLEIGDRVELVRDDGVRIKYDVIHKVIKDLDETISLKNRFYIYTCYPIGTTDQRLIIELKEVKE